MNQYSEEELIDFLINSKDFLEILAVYYINIKQLKEHTIVIFDNEMAKSINKNPPLNITKKLKTANVVSIFNSTFCILNESICYNMVKGIHADFKYKYCFNLDINMMNTLVDFHNNTAENKTSNSIISDLELLSNDTTCYPYMIENANKLNDRDLENHVINTLLIYNKFKRSTIHTFSIEYPNIEQDYQDTKSIIDMMKSFTSNEFSIILSFQKYIYALLLKVTIISLYRKYGIKRKLLEFTEFINNDLGLVLEREIVICYWFLKDKNDDRIKKFFKRIQPNAKNLIKTIQGMAWDLFHLRFCIDMGIANDINNGFFCMHYLVTYDNGLADLANAYPVKYIICKKDELVPKVVYAKCLDDIISEIDIIQNFQDNKKKRMETYKNTTIDKLIEQLEKELIE